MHNSGYKPQFLVSIFCLLLLSFLFISCSEITNLITKNNSSAEASNNSVVKDLGNINKLFIQSFTGSRRDEIRKIFFNTIRNSGKYTITEILPDDFERLGILRIKVLDFKVWETKESLTKDISLYQSSFLNKTDKQSKLVATQEESPFSALLDLLIRKEKKKKTTLQFAKSKPNIEVKKIKKIKAKKIKKIKAKKIKKTVKIRKKKTKVEEQEIINQIIRRNVLVSVQVSFFDAKSGQVLVRGIFSQPYQQIYLTKEDLKKRIPVEDELLRVSKMLSGKILREFVSRQLKKEILIPLESGVGNDWISTHYYNLGNRRINKGIRFANAGNYDKAIGVWKLVIFDADQDELELNYLLNRAAAFYNLGTIYHHKKNWWTAAQMFSQANRLQQKMKYAQSWGDNVQLWLEDQKKSVRKTVAMADESLLQRVKNAKNTKKIRPDFIHTLENEKNLLLNPRILWPLEPILKNRKNSKSDLELLKLDKKSLDNLKPQTLMKTKAIKLEPVYLEN